MKIFNQSKEFILDNIDQVQIFERFLNIKVEFDIKIKSPFRNNDTNESCSFRYNNRGKLKLKDFGTSHIDCDCFELVGFLYGLNCNDKYGFMLILDIIAKEFGLIEETILEKKLSYDVVVKTKKLITPVITDFTKEDIKYWNKGNVSIAKLKESRVFKCKLIFIDNELTYIESYNNPAYLYLFTKTEKRIYFPLSKRNKFICTSNCYQGADLLPFKQEFVIINKSFKDAISLSSFTYQGEFIESFALGSENSILRKDSFEYLKKKYKYIFTLTDYDRTGLHCAWIHRKLYNTIPLFIKNKTWNSGIKYKIKDFWDLVVHLGTEEAQKYININSQIIQEYINTNYE